MTAIERLAGVRRRLARAEAHIDELNGEHRRFIEDEPYLVYSQPDFDACEILHRVAFVKPIPEIISDIASDALHNLRSALDHMVYQLVDAREIVTKADLEIAAFPFPKNPNSDSVKSSASIRCLSDEIKQAIAGIAPYKGGNDWLWRMDRLNNHSKHRYLVTAIACATSTVHLQALKGTEQVTVRGFHGDEMTVTVGTGTLDGPSVVITDWVYPLQQDQVIHTIRPKPNVKEDVSFTASIAFHEPDVCEGIPMLDAFDAMLSETKRALKTLEPFLG